MNYSATATETTTVVRIGKGLTFHAQMKGVSTAWAACGTVSAKFGAAKQTTGIVSCRKCLDMIAAEEVLLEEQAAQAVREAEMEMDAEEAAAAETVEARLSSILAVVDTTTPVVLSGEMTEAPADCMGGFVKGDRAATKDGRVWTVVGPAQGNTTIKLTDGEKSTFRFARNLTKA